MDKNASPKIRNSNSTYLRRSQFSSPPPISTNAPRRIPHELNTLISFQNNTNSAPTYVRLGKLVGFDIESRALQVSHAHKLPEHATQVYGGIDACSSRRVLLFHFGEMQPRVIQGLVIGGWGTEKLPYLLFIFLGEMYP